MAFIKQITLPSGDVYDIKPGIIPVIGTQTASTNAWTGNIDIDELYDGLTIAYFLPYAGTSSNATLNLTLRDGTTTGAVDVYYTSTTRATTHYGVGSTIFLTYWSAGSVSVSGTAITNNRWTRCNYVDGNTIGEYAGACIAGTAGMARYSLILQTSENTWESLVTTSGTGTSKTKVTSGFLLSSPILYQSGGTYVSGESASYGSCWSVAQSIDSRYSFNCSSSWSATGKPLYLVGTITGGKFYLKDSKWWANALPSSADGSYYWYVGQMRDAYRFELLPVHPIYYHDGTEIKVYSPTIAERAISDADGNTISSTYVKASTKGAANGVAPLNSSSKIDATYLPSYVDDVLEYSAKSSFPATGETGKIYVDTSTNLTWRWGGSAYVEISPSLALGTTSSTAFRGDYGNSAYTHAVTNKGSAFTSGLYKITTNSEGHVTAATAVAKADITALGIPESDTDTKVTNTLATTTKYYVTGTTSDSTNTGTQSFDTGIYATTTAGELNATQYKLNEKAQMKWNDTSKCIDFVFV